MKCIETGLTRYAPSPRVSRPLGMLRCSLIRLFDPYDDVCPGCCVAVLEIEETLALATILFQSLHAEIPRAVKSVRVRQGLSSPRQASRRALVMRGASRLFSASHCATIGMRNPPRMDRPCEHEYDCHLYVTYHAPQNGRSYHLGVFLISLKGPATPILQHFCDG